MLAHFRLGEMSWKASCPKASEDGACLEIKRVAATGRQKVLYDLNKKLEEGEEDQRGEADAVRPPTSSKIVVFDRNKQAAAKAAGALPGRAEDLEQGRRGLEDHGQGRRGPRGPRRPTRSAGSAFYLAETQYENFLRIKFPEGLDFQQPSQYDNKRRPRPRRRRPRSRSRSSAPTSTRSPRALGQRRATSTSTVFKMKQAQWTIASSARIGQLYADFVGQLYTAEIPKDLKEQDEWGNRPREIFCDALVDKAEPIEAKAVEGFETCLKAATDYSWYNEWSRLCERELNQMKPTEYPLASEIKPEAGYVSTSMSADAGRHRAGRVGRRPRPRPVLERQVRTKVMTKHDEQDRKGLDARVGPRHRSGALGIGCGGSQAPRRERPPAPRAKRPARWAARRPSTTRSARRAPTELIPKEKKRAITEDQRADFEKAMQRYAVRQEVGRPLGLRVQQRLDAFKRVADSNPGLLEARFNQGAVLAECGREEDAVRIWKGHDQLRPGDRQPRLPGLEARRAAGGRVAVQPSHRGRPAAHGRGAQQPGADPARQGPPRVEP